MALQLWMPLMGDLRNQGLSNFDITTLGSISWVNGKLGALALKAGNGTQIINGVSINSNLTNILAEEYSVSVWVKPLGDHVHYNGTILSSGDWNKTRWAFGVNQTNSKVDILSNGHNTYLDCSVPVNEWTNLICTCDSTNRVYLYKNGELIGSSQRSDKPASDASTAAIGRETYAGGYFSFNGAIQDLRLYDHCLSSMEIKQLSQGLVLHYTLSDNCIEATTNLITSEDCLSSTCYNASTSKYSYGTSTDIYKTVTTYDGRKGTKVYMGTNGNACYPYVYVSNMYTSDGTNQPAYKTLSFDYYGTIGDYLGPYPLGSGNGTATYKIICAGNEITGTYTGFGFFPVTPNKWNHIEVTFHGITAANSEWGYIRIGNAAHTSNTSNFWFFANMQLEVKDHATGYAGVGGTRTPTIVYDNSGFCNNGIISGALTISDDTPKYTVSTQFNGTQYITGASPTTSGATLAAWVKTTSTNNQALVIDYKSGLGMGFWSSYIICSCNNSIKTTFPISAYTVNQWNHIVVVKESATTLSCYINGVKQTAGSTQDYWTTGVIDGFSIAARPNGASPISCQVSDARIYATALSASDVKSLYQNCATIDADGTIHGQIRS